MTWSVVVVLFIYVKLESMEKRVEKKIGGRI